MRAAPFFEHYKNCVKKHIRTIQISKSPGALPRPYLEESLEEENPKLNKVDLFSRSSLSFFFFFLGLGTVGGLGKCLAFALGWGELGDVDESM